MGRESNGVISLTFGYLERSDQGQLLKIRVSVRDSAIVTIDYLYKAMGHESDFVISLIFGDLERPDQGHLLKNTVYMRDSAIVTMEHELEVISRGSYGIINLTFSDLERSFKVTAETSAFARKNILTCFQLIPHTV